MQRRGYGRHLLNHILCRAAACGFGAVCLEGNIDFYGTCGFVAASRFGLRYQGLPADAEAPFFLCRVLIPDYLSGITDKYAPPQVYFVSEADADAFDRRFPPRKKMTLPGQIF